MGFDICTWHKAAGLLALVIFSLASCAHGESSARRHLALVKSGAPACTVVAISGDKPELLMTRAAEAITGTVRRWSGVEIPASMVSAKGGRLPDKPAVVLTTLDRLRDVAPALERSAGDEMLRVPFLDDHGFACVPVEGKGGTQVFVVSRTARGVYNGAVYLRDFCIDGSKSDLSLRLDPIVRTPWMGGRAIYLLTIWGNEPLYTAQDWMRELDGFARDGADRVYFWASGHFPSKKFPQTYRCVNHELDSTKDSKIGSVADLRKIIRHGHDMGLMMYLGGGLGGWCGTGMLTDGQPGTMKQGGGIASYSLCPSSPVARERLIAYYKEMFDALPEADGVYIEMADEFGDCKCSECTRPIDGRGSLQYGRSQITLIQEMAREIWRDHPHARFSFTLGYAEHKNDPAFYEAVRQMSDPRIEWMEARDSWAFPGPQGEEMPASYFSKQVMRWRDYISYSLDDIVPDAARIAKSGMYGLIIPFQPGFSTGSFYKDIPFPMDILPYVLTGFVFREVAFNPALSMEQLRGLIQARFFGEEAPKALADDVWTIHKLIRVASQGTLSPEQRSQLDQIAGRVALAEAAASPKTKDTLDLMRRAITDTIKHDEKQDR